MEKNREKRTERIPIMLTPAEVEAIDDWSFRNRVRTRAEAIRQLLAVGLAKSGEEPAQKPAGRKASEPQANRKSAADDAEPEGGHF